MEFYLNYYKATAFHLLLTLSFFLNGSHSSVLIYFYYLISQSHPSQNYSRPPTQHTNFKYVQQKITKIQLNQSNKCSMLSHLRVLFKFEMMGVKDVKEQNGYSGLQKIREPIQILNKLKRHRNNSRSMKREGCKLNRKSNPAKESGKIGRNSNYIFKSRALIRKLHASELMMVKPAQQTAEWQEDTQCYCF